MTVAGVAVKVDRIASAEELAVVGAHGVDLLGFDVDEPAYFAIDADPLFSDERYLTEDLALDLVDAVDTGTTFVGYRSEPPSAAAVETLGGRGVGLIQLDAHRHVDNSVLAACRLAGVRIIYADTYVAPEDKGSWGPARAALPERQYVDLQVFPSQGDSWGFLTTVSTEQPSEVITLADLAALAETVPLYVGLNVDENNAAAIARWIRSTAIRGLSFTLSETQIGSYHTYTLEQLDRALVALRRHD